MTDFTPRPAQSQILAYTGGKMGISAVPGSGKTHTLSRPGRPTHPLRRAWPMSRKC